MLVRIEDLKQRHVDTGDGISEVLDELARHTLDPPSSSLRDRMAQGIGFVTFAFDIDGVSMEIAKFVAIIALILFVVSLVAGGLRGRGTRI